MPPNSSCSQPVFAVWAAVEFSGRLQSLLLNFKKSPTTLLISICPTPLELYLANSKRSINFFEQIGYVVPAAVRAQKILLRLAEGNQVGQALAC